jgi:hypothetical protein
VPAAQVTAVSDLLDRVVGDEQAGPSRVLRQLRELRADLATLLGQADTYIASHEMRRDAGGLDRKVAELRARENADAREQLIREALATGDELDQLGVPSHEALDAMVADGTLHEALDDGVILWADRVGDVLEGRVAASHVVTSLTEGASADWQDPTAAEREELRARTPKAQGVSLKRDKAGLLVHTHRARSRSYPTVAAIPVSVIEWIESTG